MRKRPEKCACGGLAIFVKQRSGRYRWTYYRCAECSLEWTIQEEVADLEEPVTADEIIEVHKLLKRDVTFAELINGTS